MAGTETDKQDWLTRTEREADAPAQQTDFDRARQPGHGREADTPAEIPALGWRDIASRVFWSISSDRLVALSGSAAFFSLLAIFPAIAAIVSIYGLVADRHTVVDQVSLLDGLLPYGVVDMIRQQVLLVAGKSNDKLGFATIIGIGMAIWSANSGVASLFDALNVIYGEKEKRSFLQLYATTFMVTLSFLLFTILALTGVIVVPTALKLLGLPGLAQGALQLPTWIILLCGMMIGLAVVYRLGPSRHDAKWRWITPGSVFASLAWVLLSLGFSFYVRSFDSYNRIYGSLGAAVGFMTWTWLSLFIVLLGAKINAEMEHQTAKDSTLGNPKPLGARGANMADHVGATADEL